VQTQVVDEATKEVRAPAGDRVWVVVPAYNEETALRDTLSGVCRHWENVVVVDDGSADGTSDVAARFPVWIVRHALNCGQGAALQTGIDFALRRGADVIVTFDADGQHLPEDIARIAAPVLQGEREVALGSRFLGSSLDMPPARWLVLKLGVLFTRVFSRIQVTDTHNGLRAFSRRAARQIEIRENRMAHASDILHQIRELHLPYQEVPVTVRYTATSIEKGQRNFNALKIVGQMVLGRLIR